MAFTGKQQLSFQFNFTRPDGSHPVLFRLKLIFEVDPCLSLGLQTNHWEFQSLSAIKVAWAMEFLI